MSKEKSLDIEREDFHVSPRVITDKACSYNLYWNSKDKKGYEGSSYMGFVDCFKKHDEVVGCIVLYGDYIEEEISQLIWHIESLTISSWYPVMAYTFEVIVNGDMTEYSWRTGLAKDKD